jgi:thiol-disulfide isomerase/thioredoxin
MTEALLVAVGLLAVLTLVNFAICYGLLRRLREYPNGARPGPAGPAPGVDGPAVNAALPPFQATTVDGTEVTDRVLASGVGYLGVFTTGCGGCREELPRFVETVRILGRERVLAVVGVDGSDDPQPMVARLREVAQVIVEPALGPTATALGVTGFPALLFVDRGTVVASGTRVESLPRLQPLGG